MYAISICTDFKYKMCSLQIALARWEPAHGNFNFRHPWKLYLKIGASARTCAYHIEALNSNISSNSEVDKIIYIYILTSTVPN